MEYKEGEIVVHEGAVIHAVGSWGDGGGGSSGGNGGEEEIEKSRITMQGFSAYCDGTYIFFF